MTDERIVEEMAKLEGHTLHTYYIENKPLVGRVCGSCDREAVVCPLDDYLNDHNAVQRVIDEASESGMLVMVTNELVGDAGWEECQCIVARATPSEWCEVILKAYGKWEESGEAL